MHLKASTVPDVWISSEHVENSVDASPTQLLSLAIKKRRSLYEAKERDFRRELLHTGMIQTLCRFLGEGRARRRRRRHRAGSKKRRWDERSCAESEDEELNGEWSGDGPSSPKRYPDPHAQTSIQTWVDDGINDEPKRSSLEVAGQLSDDSEDHLVPEEEVCEEDGSLKRLLRFDGDKGEQEIQCYDKTSSELADLFDQQLREESGDLEFSDSSYTLLD